MSGSGCTCSSSTECASIPSFSSLRLKIRDFQNHYMTSKSAEELLENQSIKRWVEQSERIAETLAEGKLYDETGKGVLPHIESFIKTYELPMDELLIKDLNQYPVSTAVMCYTSHRRSLCADWRMADGRQSFNAFFSRRLVPTARPITAPKDLSIITSPADCRMTVFHTVDQAKQFWCVDMFQIGSD